VALGACTAADKAPAPEAAAAKTADAPAAPPVITIIAKDFSYEMPDTVVGGVVTITLVNKAQNLHHVQFLKLSDGKTFADLAAGFKAMKPGSPPPPWVHDVAGPNSPVPGGESSIVANLEPGAYAVVCFVDTPDHIPHFAKGMMHPMTVTAPTGAMAALPTADITVSMADYMWTLSAPLSAGKHVLKLTNTAQQSHEVLVVKLDAGKTQDDLMKWGATYQGPPPGAPVGGISGMAPGGEVYLPLDLAPGNYLFVCFLPDAKDGKPHLAHGMIKSFTVT
jgi:hypothetical protein